MARFYARFDSGSPSWTPDATTTNLLAEISTGYFDTKSIAATSASGATLRNALIASRSAVSEGIYQELDSANRDGALGIYFPPDLYVTTAGVLTGSAYTSSVPGLVIPSDYRTRPTASITSDMSTLVGPTNPLDSASVTYDVYLSASNAVKTVLDGIPDGGPYQRLGNRTERTLCSIWHDPELTYFAWDDLTPGIPQNVVLTQTSSVDFYFTNNFSYKLTWGPTYEYKNDKQAESRLSFGIWATGSGSPVQSLNKQAVSAGAQVYNWTVLQSNIASNGAYEVTREVNFRDAQVISEGGTNIGDGAIAGGTGSAVNLIRLYGPFTLQKYNGSNPALCADFGGATQNSYWQKNVASTAPTTSDVVHAATDTENHVGLSDFSSLWRLFDGNGDNRILEFDSSTTINAITTCT